MCDVRHQQTSTHTRPLTPTCPSRPWTVTLTHVTKNITRCHDGTVHVDTAGYRRQERPTHYSHTHTSPQRRHGAYARRGLLHAMQPPRATTRYDCILIAYMHGGGATTGWEHAAPPWRLAGTRDTKPTTHTQMATHRPAIGPRAHLNHAVDLGHEVLAVGLDALSDLIEQRRTLQRLHSAAGGIHRMCWRAARRCGQDSPTHNGKPRRRQTPPPPCDGTSAASPSHASRC